MAMPSVPGAGLVVIEPEFVLGGFEAILDRPAMPFDRDQGLDVCSGRAPGGEEREIAIRDAAADQETARPQARLFLVIFARVEVGELEIGPVV